jgi:hypothetical protein
VDLEAWSRTALRAIRTQLTRAGDDEGVRTLDASARCRLHLVRLLRVVVRTRHPAGDRGCDALTTALREASGLEKGFSSPDERARQPSMQYASLPYAAR